jgi:ring-1,2-phenylacetyl-CoA epoxidase subunit PaaB
MTPTVMGSDIVSPAPESGHTNTPGAPRLEEYEVFRQEKDGDPMRHGGNVLAPDPELALHYAREMFSRRNESTRLWVVRRADIAILEDADLLNPPLDRSFKKPGGYVMRDKLAAARERAGTEKPARAEGHDRTGGRR